MSSCYSCSVHEVLVLAGETALLIRPSSGIVATRLSVSPWQPGLSATRTLREFVEGWEATAAAAREKEEREKYADEEEKKATAAAAAVGKKKKKKKVKKVNKKNANTRRGDDYSSDADQEDDYDRGASDPEYHFRLPSSAVWAEWESVEAAGEMPWFVPPSSPSHGKNRQEKKGQQQQQKRVPDGVDAARETPFAHTAARRAERALWFLGTAAHHCTR